MSYCGVADVCTYIAVQVHTLTSVLLQLLCQYTEEVGFDWSVQSGDVVTAKSHLARLQVLDSHSALLRSVASTLQYV